MKDLHQNSLVKDADVPAAKTILLTGVILTDERKRSEIVVFLEKDFAMTVREDVFAPTPSPVSGRRLLLYAAWYDLFVEIGDVVCAFMQANTSCEMFARPSKER